MRPKPVACCLLASLPLPALLAAPDADTYSPAAAVDHTTHVFWGDTHVHTSFSSGDANMVGTNDADPSIAYRFARGEVVEGRNGMPVRLRRPLDFLVIADHAENLGVSFSVQSGDPALLAEEIGRQLREAWLEVRDRLGTDAERRAFNREVSATAPPPTSSRTSRPGAVGPVKPPTRATIPAAGRHGAPKAWARSRRVSTRGPA